jgi:hypothetical protein
MPAKTRTSRQILEQEFLGARAKVLELASLLDRIDRGGAPQADMEKMKLLQAAVELLLASHGDRAEQIQLVFSRPYEDNWRVQLEV